MIYASNLKKTFKNQVAVDIEKLSVEKGKLVGLVGNNGAGKTTLFRLLLDLLLPDSGSVELNHEPVKGNERWKAFTGVYIDDHFLISYLTPREYWDFILRMRDGDKVELGKKLGEFEGLLTDDIRSKKYIRELSAGNKARVGIIGALLTDPELLILDEPFANLDPSSQNFLVKLLKNRPEGQTALISSHDLHHIKSISDEIILMEKGKIIKQVPQAEQEEVMTYFQ